MYGRATLTMLVSSAPISVPTVTASVTSHGFRVPAAAIVSAETGGAGVVVAGRLPSYFGS